MSKGVLATVLDNLDYSGEGRVRQVVPGFRIDRQIEDSCMRSKGDYFLDSTVAPSKRVLATVRGDPDDSGFGGLGKVGVAI